MTTPAPDRTFRAMLPDLAFGAAVFVVVALGSVLIGVCSTFIVVAFRLPNGLGAFSLIGSLALTIYLSHIGGVFAGKGVIGIIPKHPLVFAIGTAILPLLGAVVFVALAPQPLLALLMLTPLFLLTVFIANGGYKGACRAHDPHPDARLGVGNACAECTYDLTATAEGSPCPECGGMMRLNAYMHQVPPGTPHTPSLNTPSSEAS